MSFHKIHYISTCLDLFKMNFLIHIGTRLKTKQKFLKMYKYIQKLKNNGCFVAIHAHLGCCFLLMVMLLIFLEVTTKLHLEQSWDWCQWVFLWKGFEGVASNIFACFSFSFSFAEWTLPRSNLIKITIYLLKPSLKPSFKFAETGRFS